MDSVSSCSCVSSCLRYIKSSQKALEGIEIPMSNSSLFMMQLFQVKAPGLADRKAKYADLAVCFYFHPRTYGGCNQEHICLELFVKLLEPEDNSSSFY